MLQSFLPILGTVILAVGTAAYAQQSSTKKQAPRTKKAAPIWRLRNAPPVPPQQRAFCAAFSEDEERHKKYEDKITAAAGNPIAIENIKKNEPDFKKIFFAREFEIMGDGSFKDWTGIVHLDITKGNADQIRLALVQIDFPCIWTGYEYERPDEDYSRPGVFTEKDRCKPDKEDGHILFEGACRLTFGNGYLTPFGFSTELPIEQIPFASAFGQSLAALPQDEPVAASGKLFCSKEKGCVHPYHEDGRFFATITSIRSFKTGKVFKEPAPDVKTLSQASPFIYVGNENCIEPNKQRQEKLEADLKRAEPSLLALFGRNGNGLREGTRYVPVNDDSGNPVSIGGGSVPYSLAKILDEFGKRYPCVLIPNGMPASLVKAIEPVKPVDVPHQVNPKDGQTYIFLETGSVLLPADPASGRSAELPITKAYWLGQTEVTQQAYERVTGNNPSQFKGPKLPVETVTWTEAQNYCQTVGMRLPTDLEWEYATALGKPMAVYAGMDAVGWFGLSPNDERRTHEVAQKDPNLWGFYDLLGNVAEFVADLDARLHPGMRGDPAKLTSAGMRFMRGGSWQSSEAWGYGKSDGRWGFVGFRCAGNSLPGVNSVGAVPAVAGSESTSRVPAPLPGPSIPSDDHNLKLTPASPSAERTATIVAPRGQHHGYNPYNIDISAFPNGGTLDIEITVAADSRTGGNADLFRPDRPLPTTGSLTRTLYGEYDIRPGTSKRMSYQFSPERFRSERGYVLALEGTWTVPPGSTGSLTFRVSVH